MEEKAESLVMEKFRKHGESARQEAAIKKARNEEMDRKRREKRDREAEQEWKLAIRRWKLSQFVLHCLSHSPIKLLFFSSEYVYRNL